MPSFSLFDSMADAYDGWYDTAEGNALFQEEVECLRLLCRDYSGRWLEVGVGTGRFAEALGVSCGIDLSPQMASKAARRGVRTCVGQAEHLPFPGQAFEGVLMALTLCFLANPEMALQECARVLRENGKLVLGTIPVESPWGKVYIRKGAEGHPVYAHARFHTIGETVHLVEKAGATLRCAYSALFREPGDRSAESSMVETGIVAGAGFVGLLFHSQPSGV